MKTKLITAFIFGVLSTLIVVTGIYLARPNTNVVSSILNKENITDEVEIDSDKGETNDNISQRSKEIIVGLDETSGKITPESFSSNSENKHAALINDLDVLTTVATMINAKSEENGDFGQSDTVNTNIGPILENELKRALNVADINELGLFNLDVDKYKSNMKNNIKTGTISDYAVITLGEHAGTIIYTPGIIDNEGYISFGFDISNKPVK